MRVEVLDRDVLAAAGGDRQAFSRLVEATRGPVLAIALSVVRDLAASEDVAQEVFLAAWTGLGSLRNPASFLPWIRQTTRFRARSWLRRQRRLRPADAAEERLGRLPDPAAAPDQALMRREETRRIAEALAELSSDDREVVTLFYREGRSVRQVADLLGLTEVAVRQRLSRSRARLRREVHERLATSLERTAPGAGFTAAVLAAVAAAPPAAAAGGVGLAAAKAGSGAGLAKLVAAFAGAGLGAAGGVLGVVVGLRGSFHAAREAKELVALRRFRAVAVAGTLAAVAGLVAAGELTRGWLASVAVFAGFLGFLAVLYLGVLPRIVGPRLATEAAEDPAATLRHRRHRRLAYLGLFLGALTGGLGLLAGLWLDGRLG